MRIISGKYKARRIHPPKNLKARPTTDFAKENLFNVLANMVEFEELRVLDLFSGTGSISYEFASRGCEDITLVEQNFRHFNFIRNTAKEIDIKGIHPIKGDCFRFLRSKPAPFDLIFADPPYDLPNIPDIPKLVFENNLLKPQGILIVEHSKNTDFTKHPSFTEKRVYGSVNFSFFQVP